MVTRINSARSQWENEARRQLEIGQRIRRARGVRGWTQDETAVRLGCSRRRVNRVEHGKAALSIIELEQLAEEFGVALDYFLLPPPM